MGAANGKKQLITDISVHALGTVTAFTLQVFKNDGTTNITKIGGQVGGAATGPLGPYPFNFNNPVVGVVNDNTKVSLIATGATAVTVNINYELAAG